MQKGSTVTGPSDEMRVRESRVSKRQRRSFKWKWRFPSNRKKMPHPQKMPRHLENPHKRASLAFNCTRSISRTEIGITELGLERFQAF
jgi:hypothetical protein